ncbi:MAG: hypothetical protein LBE17_03185, partial [Treponema sp.]|nr:hypothetical protein [Treponema sp.]
MWRTASRAPRTSLPKLRKQARHCRTRAEAPDPLPEAKDPGLEVPDLSPGSANLGFLRAKTLLRGT